MKYIKWICLIAGITGVIILSIKFINSNNNSNKNNETKIEEKFNFTDTYNTAWYKKGVAYYENKVLFSENLNIADSRYMVFYEGYVEYYNPMTDEIHKYNYNYNKQNQTISIDSENFFLPKGTYNIEFENDYLKISQSIDNNDYIYYFLSAKG